MSIVARSGCVGCPSSIVFTLVPAARPLAPPPVSHAVVRLALAGALALASINAVSAQTIDENLWTPNGPVHAIVRSGGTIYVGGEFDQVGPVTGGGVPVSAATGLIPHVFPRVVGSVATAIPDGAGGWYIGGSFVSVGGIPRANVARVNSDLSVSAWNPGANAGVNALELRGSSVFAAGAFTSIGGQTRSHIAELDTETGAATGWVPDFVNGETVWDLALIGSTVYMCGEFSHVGGKPRDEVASLDVTTGAVTDWNPSPDAGSLDPPHLSVSTLAVSGSTVYVGGWFSTIGGQPRNRIAALDATTGAATDWNPDANPGDPLNGWVGALTVSGSTIFVGGNFNSIGGQPRNFIAALDASTGAATAWNPNVNVALSPYGNVRQLVVSGSTVYAAGYFNGIGGQLRNNLAALDATTGLATAWNPSASAGAMTLAVSGPTVYVGGDFTSVGTIARRNLAAFDVVTGMATDWNPNANGSVVALAVSGSTVYAGGQFTSVGGQTRDRIAALDAASGAVTAWNPNANGGPGSTVLALAVGGSVVYAGGYFTNIGGATRSYVAALDPATGLATSWNANADRYVHALAISGSTLYLAGEFGGVGGLTRHGIAAVSVATAAPTGFNPNPNNSVISLAVSGSTVYAGGWFSSIGGQPRTYLAALNATTGLATSWNPGANEIVRELTVSGSTLYAGGSFSSMFGQVRNRVAAFDAVTGALATWGPTSFNGDVDALAVNGSTAYVGGYYLKFGAHPTSHIGALGAATLDAPAVPASGPLVSHLENSPNPFRTSTNITFTLHSEERVTLEVFDLAGRLVATPLRDEQLPAGPHQLEFRHPGLPSGLYLSRLKTNRDVITGRMLLLP